MTIDWQRVAPVLISVVIIIAVAIARSYSRALATLLAVMPINIPLAMYIIYSGAPDDREGFTRFVGGLAIGLVPALLFLATAYFTARAGWSFWLVLGSGYGVWAVAYLALLGLQALVTHS